MQLTKISEEEATADWQQRAGRCGGRPSMKEASARRLASSLWQLAATNSCGDVIRWRCGLSDCPGFEFSSPSPIPKFTTEGVTKWAYYHSTTPEDINHNFKLLQNEANIPNISQLQSPKPLKPGKQPKPEKGFWSGTRLINYCMKRLEQEEGISWLTTELLQMFAINKLLKDNLKRERRRRSKSFAAKLMQDYHKEKKARKILEDICNEQWVEIEAHEEEIRQLRIECRRILEEVEVERKMVQIAESWREERAHMKLTDAKCVLEDKFREMDECIAALKVILRSSDNFGGIENVLRKIEYKKSEEDDDELKDLTSDVAEWDYNADEDDSQESKKVDNLGEVSSLSGKQSRKGRLVSGFGEFCNGKKTCAVRQARAEGKAVGKRVERSDPSTQIAVPSWRN